MQTEAKPYNPYTSALNDAQREYKAIFDKKIWYPEDIARLEALNGKINRLKLLVRVYNAPR